MKREAYKGPAGSLTPLVGYKADQTRITENILPPSPNTVPNMVLWYSASSIVGSNDDAIQTWNDTSGALRDISQLTPLNQPILKTDIFNGLNALHFNNVDEKHFVRTETTDNSDVSITNIFRNAPAVTVFTVNKLNDLSGIGGCLYGVNGKPGDGTITWQPRAALYRSATNGVISVQKPIDHESSTNISITDATDYGVSPIITTQLLDYINGNSNLRVNGVLTASGTGPGSNTKNTTPSYASIGLRKNGDAPGSNNSVLGNAYITDILMFNRILTVQEIETVEQYFSVQYNIPVGV